LLKTSTQHQNLCYVCPEQLTNMLDFTNYRGSINLAKSFVIFILSLDICLEGKILFENRDACFHQIPSTL